MLTAARRWARMKPWLGWLCLGVSAASALLGAGSGYIWWMVVSGPGDDNPVGTFAAMAVLALAAVCASAGLAGLWLLRSGRRAPGSA